MGVIHSGRGHDCPLKGGSSVKQSPEGSQQISAALKQINKINIKARKNHRKRFYLTNVRQTVTNSANTSMLNGFKTRVIYGTQDSNCGFYTRHIQYKN